MKQFTFSIDISSRMILIIVQSLLLFFSHQEIEALDDIKTICPYVCPFAKAETKLNVTSSPVVSNSCFVTRWDLSQNGTGSNDEINFGLTTSGVVNYTWQEIGGGAAMGSGTLKDVKDTISGLPPNALIELSIDSANFQRIRMDQSNNKSRLLEVIQWGTVQWTTMSRAFQGCQNLNVIAVDTPYLSQVNDMFRMFSNCRNLNGPSNINDWNVSQVTSMREVFSNCNNFNQDIGDWDVSSVRNMRSMFQYASSFDQDIINWDVAKVSSMREMFRGASSFNQDIRGWMINNVVNMGGMFQDATAFDQSLSEWGLRMKSDVVLQQNNNGFLNNTRLSVANYDATLIGLSQSSLVDKNMGALGLSYCLGAAARDTLIQNRGWSITGDGMTNAEIQGRSVELCGSQDVLIEEYINGSRLGGLYYGSEFGTYPDTATVPIHISSDTTIYVIDSLGVGCSDTTLVHFDYSPGIVGLVTTTEDFICGSLRVALQDANNGDTIKFHPDLNGDTILIESKEILINKQVVIIGNGPEQTVISSKKSSRAFQIAQNEAEIMSLSIVDCATNGSTSAGGAIVNNGRLHLTNITFQDNETRRVSSQFKPTNNQKSGAYFGGAIFNGLSGMLTISGCVFINNSAQEDGGAIKNTGVLKINDSKFMANESPNGGALWLKSGIAIIRNTIFNGNKSRDGGAITNSSALELKGCLFSGNEASSRGGALFQSNEVNFSANSSYTLIELVPVLDITNCTFASNHANVAGGAIYGEKNEGSLIDHEVKMANNIVANNSDQSGHNDIYANVTDFFIDLGGNLIGVSDHVGSTEIIWNSILLGTKLLPLDPQFQDALTGNWNFGGPYSLSSCSPAIEAGLPDTTGLNLGAMDLIGSDRIYGPRIDIGAYEFQGSPQILNSISDKVASGRCGSSINFASLFPNNLEGRLEYGTSYGSYTDTITNDFTFSQDTVVYVRHQNLEGCEDVAVIRLSIDPFTSPVIYVDSSAVDSGDGTSWDMAYNDFQDAIDIACNCDTTEIWVAKGSYFPSRDVLESIEDMLEIPDMEYMTNMSTEDIPRSFYIDRDLQIYGGFSGVETSRDQRDYQQNETILHGAPPTPNGAIGSVVLTNHVTEAFIMDGVTISHGGLQEDLLESVALTSEFEPEISLVASGIVGGGWSNFEFDENCSTRGSGPTIRNCTFNNNNSFFGGAYATFAETEQNQSTFFNCNFKDNHAVEGGAIYVLNSGDPFLSPSPNDRIDSCRFKGNTALKFGGAISSDREMNIQRSHFENNIAMMDGGAIYNQGVFANGVRYFINRSVFINNKSSNNGGAIYIKRDVSSNIELNASVSNCLFVDNMAGYDGGAVYFNMGEENLWSSKQDDEAIDQATTSYNLNIGNTTFYGNRAINGMAIGLIGSTGFEESSTGLNIQNSILWDNGDSLSQSLLATNGILKIDHSLVQDDQCSNSAICEPSVIFNEYPEFVDTMNKDFRLLPCSPAYNAGSNTRTIGIGNRDLHGNDRIIDQAIDIGAYEFNGTPNIDVTHVTNTDDDGCGSLRYAMRYAMNGDTITFDPSINGQAIQWRSGEMSLGKNLVIIGNDTSRTIVDANLTSRFFRIERGDSLVIKGLTFKRGASGEEGGMLTNAGFLLVEECAIIGNRILGGGGKLSNASSNQQKSTLHTLNGGAIYSSGELIVVNSLLHNNRANSSGGAIYSSGKLSIQNASFDKNYARADGGAVFNNSVDSMQITNSIFTDNDASDDGGAIHNSENGIVHIFNCQFDRNNADDGGAIYNFHNMSIVRSIFHDGNGASRRGGRDIYSLGNLAVYASHFGGNNNKTYTEGSVFIGAQGGSPDDDIYNVLFANCTFITTLGTRSNEASAITVYPDVGGRPLINVRVKNSTIRAKGGGSYSTIGVVTGAINYVNLFVSNSIVQGDIFELSGGATDEIFITVNNSILKQTNLGPQNMDVDPLFISNSDLRLQECSPAIDHGLNDSLVMDLLDLNDDMDISELLPFDIQDSARIVNGIVDIGAYEYQQAPKRWYLDSDEDKYGDPMVYKDTCAMPIGFVANMLDCDDSDSVEYPGQTWYIDADGDDYGVSSISACERPTNGFLITELYGSGTDDCNDTDIDEYPNQSWFEDKDGDGYTTGIDSVSCAQPDNFVSLSDLENYNCSNQFSDGFESGDLSAWTAAIPIKMNDNKSTGCQGTTGVKRAFGSIIPHSGDFFYGDNKWGDCDGTHIQLLQDITIPANVNATLSLYWIVEAPFEGIRDVGVKVSIKPSSAASYEVIYNGEEVDLNNAVVAWRHLVLDLSQYAGGSSQIRLQFKHGHTTSLRYGLDDVSIKYCGGDIDCDDENPQAYPLSFHGEIESIPILGPKMICPNLENIQYATTEFPNAEYHWSYTGAGVTIAGGNSGNSLLNFQDISSGFLHVDVLSLCGDTIAKGDLLIEVGSDAFCALADCDQESIYIDDELLNADTSVDIYKVSNRITAGSIIPSDRTIVFKAGQEIEFYKEFEVEKSGLLVAEIEPCNSVTDKIREK